jgi:DNA-binding ferritin-like protein
MEGRRAEIETTLDDRTTALTQHVQQAEAAVVRRIRDLSERAAANAQAFDTKLGEATSERSKELDAFAERVMQSLDERIAQAVEESSVKSASDPRMTKLVEMIAGAQVALDQVAERVEALEAFAVAATRRRDERRRDNGPASRERDGRPAPSPAPTPTPAPAAVDAGASRGPTRDAPTSTPDLRGDG